MTDHHPDHELELYKEGDTYEVYADLPGFDREDIDVRFHDSRLHVAADHHGDGATRVFNRHVSLPRSIDAEDITASYHDGVLEVHLPIRDDERPPGTRVEVE